MRQQVTRKAYKPPAQSGKTEAILVLVRYQVLFDTDRYLNICMILDT